MEHPSPSLPRPAPLFRSFEPKTRDSRRLGGAPEDPQGAPEGDADTQHDALRSPIHSAGLVQHIFYDRPAKTSPVGKSSKVFCSVNMQTLRSLQSEGKCAVPGRVRRVLSRCDWCFLNVNIAIARCTSLHVCEQMDIRVELICLKSCFGRLIDHVFPVHRGGHRTTTPLVGLFNLVGRPRDGRCRKSSIQAATADLPKNHLEPFSSHSRQPVLANAPLAFRLHTYY